jgi:hypothetical protein
MLTSTEEFPDVLLVGDDGPLELGETALHRALARRR